jgi:hypothetical protein
VTPQQTRRNDQNSIVPAQTPRLRLKPKAPQSGYVDGAWWPHSDAQSFQTFWPCCLYAWAASTGCCIT